MAAVISASRAVFNGRNGPIAVRIDMEADIATWRCVETNELKRFIQAQPG